MRLRGDDRGQAIQVGATLLFAFLVIALSIYQAQVVPADNRAVEFQHSERVQGQLQELRGAVLRAAGTGTAQPVAVGLGARYPSRTFAVNPPPPTGTLRTVAVGRGRLYLNNTTAVDADVADLVSGDLAYPTRALVYTPRYNEYDAAPATVISNTVLYNEFAGATVVESEQRLVDGNRISLVAVDGSLAASGRDTVSVDPRGLSAATDSVAVTNASGNLTLRLPTRLSADAWRELLADQFDTGPNDGRHVVAVRAVAGAPAVEVVLEPGTTYDLRVAKVGVGSDVAPTAPAYATVVEAPASVAENSTARVVVEVRDRYNNPVTGATLNATLVNGRPPGDTVTAPGYPAGSSLANLTTDADGRVAVTYGVGDFNGNNAKVRLRFSLNGTPPPGPGDPFDADGPANVSVAFTAVNTDGSGGGSGGGGNAASQVAVSNARTGSDTAVVKFDVENTGSSSVTLTRLAVDGTTTGADLLRQPGNATIFADGSQIYNNDVTIGGASVDTADTAIGASTTSVVTTRSYQDTDGPGPPSDVDMTGQDVTVTLHFGDGTSTTVTLTV